MTITIETRRDRGKEKVSTIDVDLRDRKDGEHTRSMRSVCGTARFKTVDQTGELLGIVMTARGDTSPRWAEDSKRIARMTQASGSKLDDLANLAWALWQEADSELEDPSTDWSGTSDEG